MRHQALDMEQLVLVRDGFGYREATKQGGTRVIRSRSGASASRGCSSKWVMDDDECEKGRLEDYIDKAVFDAKPTTATTILSAGDTVPGETRQIASDRQSSRGFTIHPPFQCPGRFLSAQCKLGLGCICGR